MTSESRYWGANRTPFIIAEMSGNHNQSLERALAIVDAAADAGASALKIQTYTADTMTIDVAGEEFRIDDPGSLWNGRTLYSLYQEAYTPWEWHAPIFDRCRRRGLVPFSTPFDETAVDFLETLEAPIYKIASFEVTDLPLVRRCAATGKPMVISTGMATLSEIEQAVTTAREAGCRDLVLLRCSSAYPAPPETIRLANIPHLRATFACEVGLSDHTMGIGVSVAAVALGATVVEKHFTLCRADGGVDSAFSLEPSELAQLVVESRRAWEASRLPIHFGPVAAEDTSSKHRRSLYFMGDFPEGHVIGREDIRAIRPGLGLPPGQTETIIGMRLRRPVTRGTPVRWDCLG